MGTPILSVIICTYNRAQLLEKCLAGLCEQDASGALFEIIVVDNDSIDNTPEVVADYAARLKSLRYLKEKNRNLSIARNKGCNEAIGEYLVYLDDDAIPHPKYLSNVLNVISVQAPDILGGPIYPYYTTPKPRWFKDDYETKKFADVSGFSKTCRVTGANFIIKKSVLFEVGLFDPNHGMQGYQYVIGDERKVLETYRALTPEAQQKVYYALECFVHHHVAPHKMTIKVFLFRNYVGARTITHILKEVYGLETSARRLFIMIVRWPIDFLKSLLRLMRENGPDKLSILDVTAQSIYQFGLIVEGSTQVLQRQIVKIGRLKRLQ